MVTVMVMLTAKELSSTMWLMTRMIKTKTEQIVMTTESALILILVPVLSLSFRLRSRDAFGFEEKPKDKREKKRKKDKLLRCNEFAEQNAVKRRQF